MNDLSSKMGNLNVVNQGWNQMWANDSVNLMAEKEIRTKWLQEETVRKAQKAAQLAADPAASNRRRDVACDTNVLRCTMKRIPDSASLLQKSRLPLGLIMHPFKDDPVSCH